MCRFTCTWYLQVIIVSFPSIKDQAVALGRRRQRRCHTLSHSMYVFTLKTVVNDIRSVFAALHVQFEPYVNEVILMMLRNLFTETIKCCIFAANKFSKQYCHANEICC